MQFIQIPFIYNIVPNFTVSFCHCLLVFRISVPLFLRSINLICESNSSVVLISDKRMHPSFPTLKWMLCAWIVPISTHLRSCFWPLAGNVTNHLPTNGIYVIQLATYPKAHSSSPFFVFCLPTDIDHPPLDVCTAIIPAKEHELYILMPIFDTLCSPRCILLTQQRV